MSIEPIRTIAILFASSVVTAAAATVASWSTQDFVTLAGAITTMGLAGINLYQRFREEKRKQDGADLALYSTSQQARLDAYASEIKTLREQLDIMTKEAARWLRMYKDISGGGQPAVPPPAGLPS